MNRYKDFLAWPLAAAAILCFTAGVGLAESGDHPTTAGTAEALIVIGSVMVGAWVFALALGGHKGRRSKDLPPPSKEEGQQ